MSHHIFIVGAPFSGTSILLDLITGQPEFSWISERLNRRPERLSLTARNRRYDWPLLGEYWFERRYAVKRLPIPTARNDFWEHYLPGFAVDETHPRLPSPEDISEKEAARCREAVEEIQDQQRKSWFIGQYNGFDRVDLIRKVFPEAQFIQLQRDPRSVAIRMANQFKEAPTDTFYGARDAWKALMPPELRRRLDELPDTPLNFAGVLVRWMHLGYKTAFRQLPESDVTSLAYADLLSKPEDTLRRALKFLDLPPSPRLKRYLKYHHIQDRNKRLRKDMSEQAAAQLETAVQKLTPHSER